jgi:hypothetical protein
LLFLIKYWVDSDMSDKRAIFLFAGICMACFAGIVLIAVCARMHTASENSESPSGKTQLHRQLDAERLYFRYTGIGPDYGRLAFFDGQAMPAKFHPDLSCEAVHASGGRGLCLSADRGVVTIYTVYVFDTSTHEVVGEFPLGGAPSRTRVSPGGQVAASTVFVTGHGYDSVDFSTQTMLYDLISLTLIADLETFTVLLGGETISREDLNFWGVTFLPNDQEFYATLSSAGEHHLVKGDIASRTATVIHERVECPSISPDGTRVAYKRRKIVRAGVEWEIRVLRLRDGQDVALADERSIDDQLEWLDNEHVLYSIPDKSSPAVTNVWVSRADGTGAAALFLGEAYSPAVVR